MYIKSPNVLLKASEHYNCEDLGDGLEFENQGGNTNAFAHWERR